LKIYFDSVQLEGSKRVVRYMYVPVFKTIRRYIKM
jgi:hypothetical protein